MRRSAASNGLSPRTPWRYMMIMNVIARKPRLCRNAAIIELNIILSLKTLMFIVGNLVFRSMSMKMGSRASPTTSIATLYAAGPTNPISVAPSVIRSNIALSTVTPFKSMWPSLRSVGFIYLMPR